MTTPERTPLTLCHECDVLFVHVGQEGTAAAMDHALEEHRDTLLNDPGALVFTDIGADPGTLLACPRTIR